MTSASPLKLTAIICNYNHASWLPQALGAMLESRHPPDELIVVEDGSTDGSRAVIEQFAARSPTIRVIWHAENQGLHASVADALAVATGDWIYFGAADDYVLPEFFARAMELVRRWPQAGQVCGAYRRIQPNGELVDRKVLPGCAQPEFFAPDRYLRYLYRLKIPMLSFAPAAIIRREAVDLAGGYRRELGFWADSFQCHVAGLGWGMIYLPEDCTCFRTLPQSLGTLQNQDTARVRRIIDQAGQLMRQPPYAAMFPARYVRRWIRQARASLFFRYSTDLDAGFDPIVRALQNLPPGSSQTSRALAWLSRKVLSATYRLARWLVVQNRIAEERRKTRNRPSPGPESPTSP